MDDSASEEIQELLDRHPQYRLRCSTFRPIDLKTAQRAIERNQLVLEDHTRLVSPHRLHRLEREDDSQTVSFGVISLLAARMVGLSLHT